VKIYHYHPITKEYMGEGLADLSPLDKKHGREVWLVPANSTTERPPDAKTGYIRTFENNQWIENNIMEV
jgi:hypothetical protein